MAEEPIMLYPIVGWDTTTLPEGNVMLTLRYVPGVPPLGTTTEQIQGAALFHRFAMTAEQCDELAGMLRQEAAQSRKRRGPSH